MRFGEDRATVICITYHLGAAKDHVGVEFYELTHTSRETFPDSWGSTPTFQAQLRTWHHAAGVASSREGENLYIQQKMYEAYGAAAVVHITALDYP